MVTTKTWLAKSGSVVAKWKPGPSFLQELQPKVFTQMFQPHILPSLTQ